MKGLQVQELEVQDFFRCLQKEKEPDDEDDVPKPKEDKDPWAKVPKT